jgi:hypothetical protein
LLCGLDLRDSIRSRMIMVIQAFVPVRVSEDERRGILTCCAVDSLLSWLCCAFVRSTRRYLIRYVARCIVTDAKLLLCVQPLLRIMLNCLLQTRTSFVPGGGLHRFILRSSIPTSTTYIDRPYIDKQDGSATESTRCIQRTEGKLVYLRCREFSSRV